MVFVVVVDDVIAIGYANTKKRERVQQKKLW